MAPRDSRSLIDKPIWGNLRQGTIFTGAVADGYGRCDVFGLIITARCDLTHGKTGLVNYLPVVHFDDWLHRDFATILRDRLRPSLVGRLSDLLSSEGFSPTILDVHDYHSAVEALFPSTLTGKSIRRGTKAREAVEALRCIDHLSHLPLSQDELTTLKGISPRNASNLKRACLRNGLSGYHFLSHIDFEGQHTGFVVLLRQVYHLPIRIALAVARGMETDTNTSTSTIFVTLKPGSFAMPIGQVASPYMEHLMQNFATLFSRIGIPDPPAEFEDHLLKG